MRMDYYSILGVPKGSSDQDIKKAYRKLAMQHHPDRGGDQNKFQQIQEAYDTLSDPAKRSQYDNPQPQGNFSFHFGQSGNPFEEIFQSFGFGHGHDPFAHMRQRKNKDLRIQLDLDLHDTLQEQIKTVSVQTTTGERQTVQVNIPKGIRSGHQMRFPGLGDNMFGSIPRGDLYVLFNVRPDPQFEIEGDDLVYKVHINVLDAMIGSTIDVPTLDSKVFRLTIPAGTLHGARLRLPNQGLYTINTERRGNLLVQVNLVVPVFRSDEAKTLIQQLKHSN
jgi:DnaJ-class molecular chaperone